MEAHEDRLLSTKGLAERWSISPATITRARQGGRGLPFVKIGSRVRYRLSDIVVAEANGISFREDVVWPAPTTTQHVMEDAPPFEGGDSEVVPLQEVGSGLFKRPTPKASRTGSVPSW